MPRDAVTLRTCAVLVGVEALGLTAVAVFYLVELVVATADEAVRAVVTLLLAAAAAAGLGLVTRGLLHRRRWARAPALVTNLLLIPVSVGLLQGGRWYVGTPLLLLAIAVIGLLFAPATDAELED